LGDRAENLEQGIAHYELALTVRTRQASPDKWALLQNNLGTAYWERVRGVRKKNLKKAMACFNNALTVHTSENFPLDARRAARNLGNLLFEKGRWNEAHIAYGKAIKAAKSLYLAAFTEAGREAEIGENAALYTHDAFCLARLGQAREAFTRLEEGKTITLAERMQRTAVQLQKATLQDRQQYHALLSRLKSLEMEQREEKETRRPYTSLAKDVKETYKELNTLLGRIEVYVPDFMPKPLDYAAVQALVPDEQTAIATFCITEKGSAVLVLCQDKAPEIVNAGDYQILNAIMRNWMTFYASPDPTGEGSEIESLLKELGTSLLAPLHIKLQSLHIKKLVLIPQGSLFLLPIHAAPIDHDEHRMLDKYAISYAPSATVLKRCQERLKNMRADNLFAVADPTEDLDYVKHEIETIEPLFDSPIILRHKEATKENVAHKARDCGYVHFACHGAYSWENPLQSGLLLAGSTGQTGEEMLTLAEIESALDLNQTRLVTLSACETGITEALGPQSEEYIGLPAGFLLAGAPAVIASLWAVNEISTALLMGRFYINHLRGDPEQPQKNRFPLPSFEALRRAQIWLRGITTKDLEEYFQKQRNTYTLKGKYPPAWLSKVSRYYTLQALEHPNKRPFEHPYHWAAFGLYGTANPGG
jgi:CHAT domain-containing protein